MRIAVKPNFFSAEECAALSAATLRGVVDGWVSTGIGAGGLGSTGRKTSRLYMKGKSYPAVVGQCMNKVLTFMGLTGNPLVLGCHGADGAVTSITSKGDDVYLHCDPKLSKLSILRCNVVTQASESGGELYVGGAPVKLNAGDLHCYLASDYPHNVTTVTGDTPRILWMFGAQVSKEAWESKQILLEAS
jgi:hypothetical protein